MTARLMQTALVKPMSTSAVPLRWSNPHKRPARDFLPLDGDDMIEDESLFEPKDFTDVVPVECRPSIKRRKACKDCSCGLKEIEEAEDLIARKLPVMVETMTSI